MPCRALLRPTAGGAAGVCCASVCRLCRLPPSAGALLRPLQAPPLAAAAAAAPPLPLTGCLLPLPAARLGWCASGVLVPLCRPAACRRLGWGGVLAGCSAALPPAAVCGAAPRQRCRLRPLRLPLRLLRPLQAPPCPRRRRLGWVVPPG